MQQSAVAIRVLEEMALRSDPVSLDDFWAAVESRVSEPAARELLQLRGEGSLTSLLGGRPLMMCFVAPAENDEPVQRPDSEDGEELPLEQEPDQAS